MVESSLRTSKPARVYLAWLLSAAILGFHLWSRVAASKGMPLENRHFYPQCFKSSLSLVLGRGVHEFIDENDPAAAPVKEFFAARRKTLSPEVLARLSGVKWESLQVQQDLSNIYSLPVYLVASLWRMFGIDWEYVFFLHIALSLLACLGLIIAGRHLAGPWGGVFAGLFFSLSSMELYQGTWSLRDTSPCWFLAILLGFFFGGIRRFRRKSARLIFYFLLGITAAIGTGWRTDALMFIPLAAVLAAIWIPGGPPARPERKARVGHVVLTLSGAAFCLLALKALLGADSPPASLGFHVAYYGNATRAEELGLENSFTSCFNDSFTAFTARAYARQNRYPRLGDPAYRDPVYGRVLARMYRDAFAHQGAEYFRSYFSYLSKYLITTMSRPGYALETVDQLPPRLKGIFTGSKAIAIARAWLVAWILGLIVFLTSRRFQYLGILLSGGIAALGGITLLVLPMEKHYPTVIPFLALAGGIGAAHLFGLLKRSFSRVQPSPIRWWPGIRAGIFRLTGFVVTVGTLYLLAWGTVRLVNNRACARTGRLIAGMAVPASAPGMKTVVFNDRCVQVQIPPAVDFGGAMQGLVFSLTAVDSASEIICYQDLLDPEKDRDPSLTRFGNRLPTGLLSRFIGQAGRRVRRREFVIIFPGSEDLERRTFRYTVCLRGAGEIRFSRLIRTAGWVLPPLVALLEDGRLRVAGRLAPGSSAVDMEAVRIRERETFVPEAIFWELAWDALRPLGSSPELEPAYLVPAWRPTLDRGRLLFDLKLSRPYQYLFKLPRKTFYEGDILSIEGRLIKGQLIFGLLTTDDKWFIIRAIRGPGPFRTGMLIPKSGEYTPLITALKSREVAAEITGIGYTSSRARQSRKDP